MYGGGDTAACIHNFNMGEVPQRKFFVNAEKRIPVVQPNA